MQNSTLEKSGDHLRLIFQGSGISQLVFSISYGAKKIIDDAEFERLPRNEPDNTGMLSHGAQRRDAENRQTYI